MKLFRNTSSGLSLWASINRNACWAFAEKWALVRQLQQLWCHGCTWHAGSNRVVLSIIEMCLSHHYAPYEISKKTIPAQEMLSLGHLGQAIAQLHISSWRYTSRERQESKKRHKISSKAGMLSSERRTLDPTHFPDSTTKFSITGCDNITFMSCNTLN